MPPRLARGLARIADLRNLSDVGAMIYVRGRE